MQPDTPIPNIVQIELTNECNLECLQCYASSGKKKSNELSTPEIKRVISEIYKAGTRIILFTGGEPLLHPDIIELCKTVKSYGLDFGINSNGTLLTNERAKELSKLGIKFFSISLHGMKKSTHETLCGKNSYDRVLKAISTSIRHNLPLIISSIISKVNHAEVPLILEYATLIGAKGISVFRFLPIGRGLRFKNKLHVDNNLHKNVISDMLSIASNSTKLIFRIEAPYVDTSWQDKKTIETVPCLAGAGVCTVTPDGDILGCNGLRDQSLVAGNVRDSEFGEIWSESTFFKQIRSVNKDWKKLCPSCERGDKCGGGCRAVAIAESNNIFANDPYCFG